MCGYLSNFEDFLAMIPDRFRLLQEPGCWRKEQQWTHPSMWTEPFVVEDEIHARMLTVIVGQHE